MNVVITGGSKGIGRATVIRFIKDGHKVCTCSRSEEGLKTLWEEFGHTGKLFLKRCDVSERSSAKEFVYFCAEKLGGFDVLINNAGILGVRESIQNYPEDIWEEVIRTNINGTFYVTKYALTFMKERGVIINFSSGVGKRPAPYWGAYAVSKFGIEGFSLLLAHELKDRGIRVYAFNPGATRTQMRSSAYPQEDPMSLKPPEKVADFIIRLINSHLPSGSVDYQE
ncbi:MAG: SDR family oxidoreductase [Hydrogenobacter sp.]|uniref:SDR family NAD(P)-dependent oxidoreductase n=1 Tax=Hydrogenobacter thermophilus TaxID=940 RepID=UPI0030F9B7B4